MQYRDHQGLRVECGDLRSVDRFERALGLLHSYSPDPLAAIDEALAEDPQFLMGHAFRAALFVVSSEKRAVPELERSVQAGEALIARGLGTARERAHIAAARAWLDGSFELAAARYNRILIDHPRDALALQVGHLCNFFLGRSTWLRDQVAGALPHYTPSDASYPYALGMLAFGLEECNEFARAEATAERALAQQPRDAWAIHALAHCAEMQGRSAEGIHLYRSRQPDWAENSTFAIHNWWHLALFYIDLGDVDAALGIYDERIRGGRSEVILDLVDASAFLWRLEVSGASVGERWQELAETYQRIGEEGYYAFNDFHALMAYAGARRALDVDRLLAGLARRARDGDTNAAMAREVALPASRAFASFAAGDHLAAVSDLFDLRPVSARFGGSNAQRDILEWTLLEAALRLEDTALARALVEARIARKPHGARDRRLLARLVGRTAPRDARLQERDAIAPA